jgi:LPXTG-motif cell wall-anchored protein
MSFSRRLAAGLPAAGVTVLAALAFAGSQATAAEPAAQGALPAVTASPDPTADTRGNAGYGGDVAEAPGDTTAVTPTNTTDDTPPGGTRGKPGYVQSATPSTGTPTPSTPAPSTPVGLASESVGPETPVSTSGAGVSSGSTLPVTGAPLTGTLVAGGLMVAAGGAAVWYTRRRRNA